MTFENREARHRLWERRGIKNEDRKKAEMMIVNRQFLEEEIPWLWQQWNVVLEDISYAKALQEAIYKQYAIYILIPGLDNHEMMLYEAISNNHRIKTLWMLDDVYKKLLVPFCYITENLTIAHLWRLSTVPNRVNDINILFKVIDNIYKQSNNIHFYKILYDFLQHTPMYDDKTIISDCLFACLQKFLTQYEGQLAPEEELDWWYSKMHVYPKMFDDRESVEFFCEISGMPPSLKNDLLASYSMYDCLTMHQSTTVVEHLIDWWQHQKKSAYPSESPLWL